MSMKFCSIPTRNYPKEASERTDEDLLSHMFDHYPTLTEHTIMRVDVRHWRRCVIRELLKRGLLARDPGFGPPERR